MPKRKCAATSTPAARGSNVVPIKLAHASVNERGQYIEDTPTFDILMNLMNKAHAGKINGIAFVVSYPDRRTPEVGMIGQFRRDPHKALAGTARLMHAVNLMIDDKEGGGNE